MPAESITKKLLDRIGNDDAPAKEYEIQDTSLRGFLIRVMPSGKILFAIRYARGSLRFHLFGKSGSPPQ
jgi:hypothetical protein